jgi:DNA-binding transcriptional LysR family regulator
MLKTSEYSNNAMNLIIIIAYSHSLNENGTMDPSVDLLDIKHLSLLDQLYSTQSVTRAAEALGQSQPTVSIWLAKMRTALGDPLFVRTADGMLPTPRAEALMPTVREVLGGLRRLSEASDAFSPATAQRRFAICMTDASHITLLPRLLAHVRALAPSVSLAASRIDANLAASLQGGEADLGLGYLPGLDTGFYQQTLFAQDWICLVNAQHPRVSSDAPGHWNLCAYQREGHIGISAGTGYQLMDEAVKAQHIERRIQLELPGFLGLSAILSTSDLVATLPRQIGETLARAAGLRALPCPFDIPGFTVKQYWHARYHHDVASRWLRGVCADLFMTG